MGGTVASHQQGVQFESWLKLKVKSFLEKHIHLKILKPIKGKCKTLLVTDGPVEYWTADYYTELLVALDKNIRYIVGVLT